MACSWSTAELAYLVFYQVHLAFIPIEYADVSKRLRRYEYANPYIFRHLNRLFRELYGMNERPGGATTGRVGPC